MVGSLLSGGLDSSAIVALAARVLEKRNQSLLSFSAVLPEENTTGLEDERRFIDEFRGFPNLQMEYVVPAADSGPFDSIDHPETFEDAFRINSRRYVYTAIHRAAALQGVSTMLDGAGGEFTASAYGSHYPLEMALTGKWLPLARHCRIIAGRGQSPMKSLLSQAIGALRPSGRMKPFVMLNPEFSADSKVTYRRHRGWPDHRQETLTSTREILMTHAESGILQQRWPIHYTFPLFDRRLVDFCVSAPGSMKLRDGYPRYLLRGALDGILSKKIQWRTDKTEFSPDYFLRYNRQLEKARDWVLAISPSDPVRGVVDVPLLLERLVPYRPGDIRWSAGVLVPTTIYLICYLRQFPEFRV